MQSPSTGRARRFRFSRLGLQWRHPGWIARTPPAPPAETAVPPPLYTQAAREVPPDEMPDPDGPVQLFYRVLLYPALTRRFALLVVLVGGCLLVLLAVGVTVVLYLHLSPLRWAGVGGGGLLSVLSMLGFRSLRRRKGGGAETGSAD